MTINTSIIAAIKTEDSELNSFLKKIGADLNPDLDPILAVSKSIYHPSNSNLLTSYLDTIRLFHPVHNSLPVLFQASKFAQYDVIFYLTCAHPQYLHHNILCAGHDFLANSEMPAMLVRIPQNNAAVSGVTQDIHITNGCVDYEHVSKALLPATLNSIITAQCKYDSYRVGLFIKKSSLLEIEKIWLHYLTEQEITRSYISDRATEKPLRTLTTEVGQQRLIQHTPNSSIDLQALTACARSATTSKNWTRAIRFWSAVLHVSKENAAPEVYSYLGSVYRNKKDLNSAEQILRKGRNNHPNHVQILVEFAWWAQASKNWPEAARYWQLVIDKLGDRAPVSRAISFVKALRFAGEHEKAERQCRVFLQWYPDAIDLMIELSEISMSQLDWPLAIDRWRHILNIYGTKTPPDLYVRLSIALRSYGDYEAAQKIVIQGQENHPDFMKLATEFAEIAMTQRAWSDAILRWEHVLHTHNNRAASGVYLRMSMALRNDGHYIRANSIVLQGLTKHPIDKGLASEHAELAMYDRDWHKAVQRWQKVVDLYSESGNINYSLPSRGRIYDWWEGSWKSIAESIIEYSNLENFYINHALYLKIANVLQQTDYLQEADEFLGYALRCSPNDIELASAYAKAAMLAKNWRIAIKRWQTLIKRHGSGAPEDVYVRLSLCCQHVGNACLLKKTVKKLTEQYVDFSETGNLIQHNNKIINSYRYKGIAAKKIQFYFIQYESNSLLAEQIETGVLLTTDHIGRLIQEHCGGKTGSVKNSSIYRLVNKISKHLANKFSHLYPPNTIPKKILADAILPFIATELRVLIPIRHLSRKLACKYGNNPIFIPVVKNLKFYTLQTFFSQLEPFYLYHELKRRGANVFLVIKDCTPYQSQGECLLRFLPSPYWRRKHVPSNTYTSLPSNLAILPDGIRGAEIIFKDVNAHIFTAVSLTPLKPYTNKNSATNLFFTDSLYSDGDLPEAMSLPLKYSENLMNISFENTPTESKILKSDCIHSNMLHMLNTVIGGLIERITQNALNFVKEKQIQELHICDHLFMESVIMAYAVSYYRGKVTFWPHSSNPVHYYLRRHDDTVNKIVCCTRSGKDIWKSCYPNVDIEVRSGIMLDAPSKLKPSIQNSKRKISIVMFGSGTVIGRMPVMPLHGHFSAYNKFFTALNNHRESFDLFFKGRGIHLDSFSWFEKIADKNITWQPALDHILDMDFPNMLSISVTMGSSALLEGMGRGIPAMVIREKDIEDYNKLPGNIVPTGSVDYIISELEKCLDYNYRLLLIEKQFKYYCEQTQDIHL